MCIPRSNFLMKALFVLFFATNQGKNTFGSVMHDLKQIYIAI